LAASNLDQLQNALAPNYTIERELGRGGMATVYLARNTKHQRLVAWLRIDPNFKPLRGNPRFEKLAAGTSTVS
jgi:eukaryotic-like serine/threonine-protein kinase